MTIPEFANILIDSGSKVSDADLDDFEAKLSMKLPMDYRSFLLLSNGGFPSENVGVMEVYGITDCEFSIIELMDDYNSEGYYRIPKGFVWLMNDGCGNGHCLSTRSDTFGKVYLWSHDCEVVQHLEVEEPDLAEYSNVDFVAGSFTDFIADIRLLDAPKRRPSLP